MELNASYVYSTFHIYIRPVTIATDFHTFTSRFTSMQNLKEVTWAAAGVRSRSQPREAKATEAQASNTHNSLTVYGVNKAAYPALHADYLRSPKPPHRPRTRY